MNQVKLTLLEGGLKEGEVGRVDVSKKSLEFIASIDRATQIFLEDGIVVMSKKDEEDWLGKFAEEGYSKSTGEAILEIAKEFLAMKSKFIGIFDRPQVK